MKHSILLISLLFLFSIGVANAANTSVALVKPATVQAPYPRAPKIIPVVANVIDMDLFINFTASVGIATISVTDETGEIVYYYTIDTSSTPDLYIPLVGFDSGEYTVSIAYDSTSLKGVFLLE